jgi:hypothetical protein
MTYVSAAGSSDLGGLRASQIITVFLKQRNQLAHGLGFELSACDTLLHLDVCHRKSFK